MSVLKNLTKVVIGKLGKLIHKQNGSHELLLKQKKRTVLDITGFFFHMRAHVTAFT
jgi:hypothetical protein